MDGKSSKSNTKSCQPFHFCAQLALLTAAACGVQCGACEPDITYFTKNAEVIRKRRRPKRVEIESQQKQQCSTFQIFRKARTNKHKHAQRFDKHWNTDSGATISVTNNPGIFKTIDEVNPNMDVQVANGQRIRPTMRGTGLGLTCGSKLSAHTQTSHGSTTRARGVSYR